MPLKPDALPWTIMEQIVEDPVSGLSLQFERMADGTARLLLFGESLPFGNRELIFDADGKEAGGGTVARGLCRPAWLTEIDS